MALSTFLRCLLLLIACQVVISSESKNKKIAMHYKVGDWRPHFNYNPAHKASHHRVSSRTRAKDLPNTRSFDQSDNLDAFVVRLWHKQMFLCSGILLNAEEVLVPKLCVSSWPASKIDVYLLDESVHKVASIVNSTMFTVDLDSDLLAQLKLAEPLQETFELPPFCQTYLQLGETVEQFSWDKKRKFLNKKLLTQVPEDACRQKLGDIHGVVVTPGISCVENRKMSGKCDLSVYGMPYVWEGSFCGLNLLGHNCPNVTSVDLYVRLMVTEKYISQKIREVRDSNLERYIFRR